MYFELATGRIVTETEIELAYEICTAGWNRVFDKSEITVEQLIKGDAFVQAVKLYKDQHNCTLAEAREACDKIRKEMEA